ncbi:MAG: glucose-6-phosphate isomerase [Rhodocyclaceae bacterium]|nr:glucose-6-phosphate isomerase [Rhodocyclaceae bacterium]
MSTLTRSAPWQRLQQHSREMQAARVAELFQRDPARAATYSLERAGIFLDYSKQLVTAETLELLLQLAAERGVEARRDAMFAGRAINSTEGRAVLHTALRRPAAGAGGAANDDLAADVERELARMGQFASAVRAAGVDGRPLRDIVNIGIGGSDLGPRLVCEALEELAPDGLRLHFLSNPDSSAVLRVLKRIDPAHTLVVVSSKTFTTQETLANYATVQQWLARALGSEAAAQARCVAVTANPPAAAALGFAPKRTFRFWDWVGGRYSLWSAIGLPIMLALGETGFRQLLAGAAAMDAHFRNEPLATNLPVLLALLGIWNRNFLDAGTQLIAPYDARLARLPAYIQQLDMESNGKRVDLSGEPVDYGTGPVVWGDLGINGQHAFFQLVHQGTQRVPVDFIGVLDAAGGLPEHQRIVHSNMLAQAEALMTGRDWDATRRELIASGLEPEAAERLAPHRAFPGNVPSNTLLLDAVTPHTLGALIALYEHKVFVQGAVWGINSYDQWGVELGKELGKRIYGELAGAPQQRAHDASTTALIERVKTALGNKPGVQL